MAGPSQEASGERNQICSNFGFSLVAKICNVCFSKPKKNGFYYCTEIFSGGHSLQLLFAWHWVTLSDTVRVTLLWFGFVPLLSWAGCCSVPVMQCRDAPNVCWILGILWVMFGWKWSFNSHHIVRDEALFCFVWMVVFLSWRSSSAPPDYSVFHFIAVWAWKLLSEDLLQKYIP